MKVEKPNIFYTYLYFDPDTNDCVYVGKGHKNRNISHIKLCFKSNDPKAYYARFYTYLRELLNSGKKPVIQIVLKDISEQQAFEEEIRLIAKYKRIEHGGTLFNRTNGGDGGAGSIQSPETKDRLRKISKKQWADMSEKDRSEHIEKVKKGHKAWWDSLTEEEQKTFTIKNSENQRRFWNSMSEDEQQKYKDKMQSARKEALASMSKDEVEKMKQKMSLPSAAWWVHCTPEQKLLRCKNNGDARRQEWILKSPTEEIFIVKNLEDFCREHKISYHTIAGKIDRSTPISKGPAKGWMVIMSSYPLKPLKN